MADINFGTVAYLLGILSIVFAFFSPLAGLVLGIVGFVQSKKIKFERARKLNIIGIGLSVIFIVISIVFLIYSVNTGLDTGGTFPIF